MIGMELLRLQELEQRRLAQEELVRLLHEKDKEEFIRKRREEEEELKRRNELERQKREEEVQRAIEEAKRIALEELIRRAETERKLEFQRSLRIESNYFDFSQRITRAFVFSYIDLLRYLSVHVSGLRGVKKIVKSTSKASSDK
jgi:hypothetical protein